MINERKNENFTLALLGLVVGSNCRLVSIPAFTSALSSSFFPFLCVVVYFLLSHAADEFTLT